MRRLLETIYKAPGWGGSKLVFPTAPAKPLRARTITMSWGAASSCTQADIDTINQVAANGVLVVVSAGNEGGPVDTPTNWLGVAAGAGIRHGRTKVGYTNPGPENSLGGPSGKCRNTAPRAT